MKVFILFMILLNFCLNGGETNIKDNIYIFEYSPKIYGNMIIGFTSIDSSSKVIITTYKLYFEDYEIKSIKKSLKIYNGEISKKENGDIILENENLKCFNSSNFLSNKKYSEDLYKMIDMNFLNLTNSKRYEILEKLIENISQ